MPETDQTPVATTDTEALPPDLAQIEALAFETGWPPCHPLSAFWQVRWQSR